MARGMGRRPGDRAWEVGRDLRARSRWARSQCGLFLACFCACLGREPWSYVLSGARGSGAGFWRRGGACPLRRAGCILWVIAPAEPWGTSLEEAKKFPAADVFTADVP